mmetsp:Transcript_75487/g.221316  ORF Transcript_75487/g.221316 Transcript_75487/m.221316 type:complete len:262 (-) Transcript_75487:1978-2763(-)
MPSGTITSTCFCISLCSSWCKYVSARGIPSSPALGWLTASGALKESSVGSATSVPPVSVSDELSMAEASASKSASSMGRPLLPGGRVPGSTKRSIIASAGSSSGSAARNSSNILGTATSMMPRGVGAMSRPIWNTDGKHADSSRGDSVGCGSRAGSGSSVKYVDCDCLEMSSSPRSWLSSGATCGTALASGREGASASSSGCCADVLRALCKPSASKAVPSAMALSAPWQHSPMSCSTPLRTPSGEFPVLVEVATSATVRC